MKKINSIPAKTSTASHWQMVSCCVGSPTINLLEYRTAEITLALSQVCGEESDSLSWLDTPNRHLPQALVPTEFASVHCTVIIYIVAVKHFEMPSF